MILNIDGLTVYFPYEFIYLEQYLYMVELKKSLDEEGHCVLEMPNGTGKTVSLLSLIVAYLKTYPTKVKRLIYCSRTMPELERVVQELEHLSEYWQKETAQPLALLGLSLTSRKNLCIHSKEREERDGKVVDGMCSFVGERPQTYPTDPVCDYCELFNEEEYKMVLPPGIYNLDSLKLYGMQKNWCPYFLARYSLSHADIIVCSYNYLLDPKLAELVSKKSGRNSVVVFDEAHNIDNVCIELMSLHLSMNTFEKCFQNLDNLKKQIEKVKKHDERKIKDEYRRLVGGLRNTQVTRDTDVILANPILPDEILNESVPGCIRDCEHFVLFMERFSNFLKSKTQVEHFVRQIPASFLKECLQKVHIERKSLRFCSERLRSLLQTLEVSDLQDYSGIITVANFASLISTYVRGFTLFIESKTPTTSNLIMHLTCLDASIAIKPVFNRFNTVVITSGTLSTLEMYPKILDFHPITMASFSMSLSRQGFRPMVVSRGNDQVALTSKLDAKEDGAVIRNYGNLLIDMASVIPDGLVCFFTSYIYMETIVGTWYKLGIIDQVMKYKLLCIETTDAQSTSVALANYQKACDKGRGAVMFCVARGKVSEEIDFDNHYGRGVIIFGVPYVYTQSSMFKARLEFLSDKYHIKENDFLTFDAMRQAAQCVGRTIGGKSDYGVTVFADKRFARPDKKGRLPKWIQEYMTDGICNMSIEDAVQLSKQFFKNVAQPFTKEDQLGISLLTYEQLMSEEVQKRMDYQIS